MAFKIDENLFFVNKYAKWYYNVVNKAQSANRSKKDGNYYELHHVIPKSKSFGGSNKKSNTVLLTAKEHYICHLLLLKMCEGKRKRDMYWAFLLMRKNKHLVDRHTSNSFDFFRKQYASSVSGSNAYWYGKKFSDETKKKMSDNTQGKSNPNYGNKWSEQQKKLVSEKMLNRYNGDKNPFFGRRHSEETKKKQSLAKKTNEIRMAHAKTWVITFPTGEELEIKNLKLFCSEFNLPYTSLITRNCSKGFTVRKVHGI
jgi:hypothetical protein